MGKRCTMGKPRSYRSFTQSGRGEIARTVPPMVIGSQALSVAIMGPSTLLTEQTRSSTPGFRVSIWAPEEHSLCPDHLHKLSTQQRGCHMVAAQQTFASESPTPLPSPHTLLPFTPWTFFSFTITHRDQDSASLVQALTIILQHREVTLMLTIPSIIE